MRNHTPGPWQYICDFSGEYVADANGKVIAMLGGCRSRDEAEGNAHRLAAAPELLDQVEDGCRVVADIVAVYADAIGTESEPGWIADLREWLTTARAAIAKAKGGA